MSAATPFVRVPGELPYSDYNTDRGRKEEMTAEACRLLVDSYEGDVDDEGRFHGHARAVYASGICYEGDFHHGSATGRGRLSWPSGEVYEGEVLDGRAHGEGRTEWADGTSYEGQLAAGRRDGFGVLVTAHGVRYEGRWRRGLRHGEGRLVYGVARREGEEDVVVEYVGRFERDRRHGVGRVRYETGSVYEGEWRDDRKHGRGVMVWPAAGQVFQGEWREDLPWGSGVSVWERRAEADDGSASAADATRRPMLSRYEGDLVAGARHGVGTFYYADGARYTGTWRSGLKHGLGVLVSADGGVYEGVFERDRPRDAGAARGDGPLSARSTERQGTFALHVDDVITGAQPSVKGRSAGTLAGPAGAALAGLAASRAVGASSLAGGGVSGSRGLSLATRRDAAATQRVLSRWMPLLRRWYDAACAEGTADRGGPLEIADAERAPTRKLEEASAGGASGGGGAAAAAGGAGLRPAGVDVPGLALRTLETVGEGQEEEEEAEEEEGGEGSVGGRGSRATGASSLVGGGGDGSGGGGRSKRSGAGSVAGSVPGGSGPLTPGEGKEDASEGKDDEDEVGRGAGEDAEGEQGGSAGSDGSPDGSPAGAGEGESDVLDGLVSAHTSAPTSPRPSAREAAEATGPGRAHRLAAVRQGDAGRAAGADPLADPGAGVFALPQRGLWRVVRAMGLLRPPVTTAVVDHVLALVRARHARRVLAGLEATRRREFGAADDAAGGEAAAGAAGRVSEASGAGSRVAKSVSMGRLPGVASPDSSSRAGTPQGRADAGSPADAAAAAADGSDPGPLAPTDEEMSRLRDRVTAALAAPCHDPARPVLFREFLEVIVRLSRILYSAGRRPPTSAAALEAASRARQADRALAAASVLGSVSAPVSAMGATSAGFSVTPLPSVADAPSRADAGAPAFRSSRRGQASRGEPKPPAHVASARRASLSRSSRRPPPGTPEPGAPPPVTASSALQAPPCPSRAVPASSLAFAVDCAMWYRAVPAAAALSVAAHPGQRQPPLPTAGSPSRSSWHPAPASLLSPGPSASSLPPLVTGHAGSTAPASVAGETSFPDALPAPPAQRWDSAGGGLRGLLFDLDALAALDALAPALRTLFLRYSEPDDGPLGTPSSADPGSLTGILPPRGPAGGTIGASMAASRASVHGRVVTGGGLLRLVRDAGLAAADFGPAEAAAVMRRSLYDLGGASGRADMGSTGLGLGADETTTGVVAPRREVLEAEEAARDEEEAVLIADRGLVLVPDEEEDDAAGKQEEEGAKKAEAEAAEAAEAAATVAASGKDKGKPSKSKPKAGDAKAKAAEAKADEEEEGKEAGATAAGDESGDAPDPNATAEPHGAAAGSSADLGLAATASDWPLVLTRLLVAMLRLAPRRAVASVAHARLVETTRRRLQAEARAAAEAAAAAAAAAEAAAGAKKKGAKGKGKAAPEPELVVPDVTAEQVAACVGPAPAAPLLLPGASAPATRAEVAEAPALAGTPVAPGRGAPAAVKLQGFVTSVLLRRIGVPGFTEAFARTDPLAEAGGGGKLSARAGKSPRPGLSAGESAAASAAASAESARVAKEQA